MESTDFDPTAFHIDTDPRTMRMSGRAIHGDTLFDVPFITRVDNNLWQGGCEDGLILPDHIDHVLSLYKWEKYTVLHRLQSSKTVTMYDEARKPNLNEVVELARYVNECRQTGTVLVHCQAGLNRSGLITVLALMLDGMDADTAIKWLREQRSPAVLCNPVFEQFLRDLCHCGCWTGDYPCEAGMAGEGCVDDYPTRDRFGGPIQPAPSKPTPEWVERYGAW